MLRLLVSGFLLVGCVTWAAAESQGRFHVYGFLLPTWSISSSAVESFSQPNGSAYTAAGNPVLASVPQSARSTFQVAQSRLGVVASLNPTLKGRLEFDFIDFTKASPTTAALPRLRRGVVEMGADELMLRVGQDWDLVSPLAPHTFNYVGHYFESGDIGFMRIQAQLLLRSGKFEHALALGLPGNNNSASDSALELGLMPTIALRETFHWGENKIGASLIATSLRLDRSVSTSSFAGALTAFAALRPSSSWEIHSEIYLGQNVYSLGLLGLSFADLSAPAIQEAGCYVTLRIVASGTLSLFAGVGGAAVLNPQSMHASYSHPTASTSVLAGTGPGIESNYTIRGGLEARLDEAVSFFGEVAGLVTRSHLLSADSGTEPLSSAVLTQAGILLTL